MQMPRINLLLEYSFHRRGTLLLELLQSRSMAAAIW